MPAASLAKALGADLGAKSINNTFYHRCFDDLCADELNVLPRKTAEIEAIRAMPDDKWCESFGPVAMDDTMLLGVRAEIDSSMAKRGIFVHRYIAWSKAQQRVAAHGGATIRCESLDGEPVNIPDGWVYRMEVDYGDAWAAQKILEFRREAGLPNHMMGRTGLEIDDDL